MIFYNHALTRGNLVYLQIQFEDSLRLRDIISKALNNDTVWLKEKCISVSPKEDYLMLNYGIGDSNEYNRLVRGLTVDKEGRIVGFPFTRFFNYGDPNAAQLGIQHCDMLEKLDGCFVSLFYDRAKSRWLFGTRRMLSCHHIDLHNQVKGFDGKLYYLMQEITPHINILLHNSGHILNKNDNVTYCFEFIHPSTQVLTQYQPADYGLYLIGARSLTDYNEFTENLLDNIAEQIGVKRPRRFSATNFDEVYALMKAQEDSVENFEGFIFRDRITSDRIKLKSKEYVRLHYLVGKSSPTTLLLNILNNKVDDIIAYFPYLEDQIKDIEKKLYDFVDKVYNEVKYWTSKYETEGLTNKQLWGMLEAHSLDAYTKSQIMHYVRLPNIKEALNYDRIFGAIWELHVNKLADILGLKDKP